MHESQSHKSRIDPSLLNTPAHCDICNREFASYVNLEQHNEDTHKVPAVPTPAPTDPPIITIALSVNVNILVTLRKTSTVTREPDTGMITSLGVTNVNLFQTILMT